jgi:transcriptional regulator with XRE-family HTH domain
MLERAKRLQEVYVYLHKNRNIPTKAEFAESIDYARAYVSSALNGNEKYLTNKLFESICEKFQELNLEYLLHGKGELLRENKKEDTTHNDNALELYAQMIRGLDDLRQQLKQELAEIKYLKQEYMQARDDFRKAVAMLHPSVTYINPSDQPRMAAENTPEK